MTTPLTVPVARTIVLNALHQVVPDEDLTVLGDDRPFRSELELDSLDFLSFVENLSAATGIRIDESDYDAVTSVASCVSFLTARGAAL
ncbi:MAG TPA: acyl carrier protein [Nocardioides sp.]|nr:acyl carrier protein [Nocardioides sp.]